LKCGLAVAFEVQIAGVAIAGHFPVAAEGQSSSNGCGLGPGVSMKRISPFLFLLAISGCASSSVMPLAADTVQITTSAAPICGAAGAQSVAAKQAAMETIKRGFDRFVIIGGYADNNVSVVGHTPVYADTYGSATSTISGNNIYTSGSSRTTYSGGAPIIAGSHDQVVTVKMFRDDDPVGVNALSARAELGPDWQAIVKSGKFGGCL